VLDDFNDAIKALFPTFGKSPMGVLKSRTAISTTEITPNALMSRPLGRGSAALAQGDEAPVPATGRCSSEKQLLFLYVLFVFLYA